MPTRPSGGVVVNGVTRAFADGRRAIEGLSLRVSPGEFVALLGPSGCGKSTLLRLIAGLDRPTDGTVTADAGGTAFVFQDPHLLPWRRVIDNAALPLELAGVDKADRRARAAESLRRVGLSDDVHGLYPAQLSGGMRMRVSLARALVIRPTLLLLDEPFAALDEIIRQQLDDLLRSLWQQGGLTVLFVTHSVQEAAYLADRVIVLSPRPTTVTSDMPIDLPAGRDAMLRTTAAFAEQARQLYDALAGTAPSPVVPNGRESG